MDPTRAGLEAALAADPDDLVTHAAYADYLSECGDPRGDYIRLQLALEDSTQHVFRLRAWEREATRLREQHEAEWLGPLYPYVQRSWAGKMYADFGTLNVEVEYRRGWVRRLRVDLLTPDLADAVAAAPLMGLLAELEVVPRGREQVDPDALGRWVGAGFIAGLRRLTMSGVADGRGIAPLLASSRQINYLDLSGQVIVMSPEMTELPSTLETLRLTCNQVVMAGGRLSLGRTLPVLRLLHLDMRGDHTYSAEWESLIRGLADPAVLPGLKVLALRLPYFDDDDVSVLLASGLVGRLKGLDLCRCQITDDGAQALAADPAVPRLEYLHLDDNYLSPIGIQALADVGVTVSERQRFGPAGDDGIGGDPADDIPF